MLATLSLHSAAPTWAVVQVKPGGVAVQLAPSQAINEVKGGAGAGHVKLAGHNGDAPAGAEAGGCGEKRPPAGGVA